MSYSMFIDDDYIPHNITGFSTVQKRKRYQWVDDNNITYGSKSVLLQSGEIATISSSDISAGTVINGTGPFEATFDSNRVDMPVPESFKGTEFVFDAVREAQNISICAPFEEANTSFYNDTGISVGHLNLTKGNCGFFAYAFSNDWYYLKSTGMVVAQADNGATGADWDGYVLYPMSNDVWGIASSGGYGIGKNNSEVNLYQSEGTTSTNTRNFGDQIGTGGGGGQGIGDAFHLTSNVSGIGASQTADGDGGEATTWYPYKELSHVFALPMDAQYISVATTRPYTNCYLRYANGTLSVLEHGNGTSQNQSHSGSLDYPFPNKIYFGNSTPNTPTNFINKGTFMICDSLVYAYYEEDGADDETNMWG